tara:strand:- start:30 stop:887 length:858 start_codon:yes stop_codon:yes gene_type:complete
MLNAINKKNKIKLLKEQLLDKANFIRKDLIEVTSKNGAGHIAPSLSCVDLLVALYYHIMNFSDDPQWEERDRLVFSKAHGCYGVYSILADIGYIERENWVNFYKGSTLKGCLERSIEHGIEASCGSLGHGLPQAVGMALGAKIQKKNYHIYCLVGDGEMQEGSNWEAIQVAVKYELTNLTVMIDQNRLQAMDFLENVLTPKGRKDDLKIKMEAFGFISKICDGHNLEEIATILNNRKENQQKNKAPFVLIANTIKGYGMICMENVPKFHFRIPTKEERKKGVRYE